LAGEIGHKRLVTVYGEHPDSDVHYIADSLRTIYSVKVKTKSGYGQIRRVNVNCAPLSIADLVILKEAGIGTYQVFQETYHRRTYQKYHPASTVKGNYHWRLYCMHRALEAGIDDVGIGVLFGLYDWKFEVMGLVSHARELEKRFSGIGPHTVSIPRLEPAMNAAHVLETGYKVSDDEFKRLAAVIRLAIPYAGMILTARESPGIRREIIPIGCTQTDASSRIESEYTARNILVRKKTGSNFYWEIPALLMKSSLSWQAWGISRHFVLPVTAVAEREIALWSFYVQVKRDNSVN
jgi:2-iminoacetate synthase